MAAQAEYYDEPPPREQPRAEEAQLRAFASIVPADSISGRALLAVIEIMTFLAALTLGAVVLVRSAAGEWQSAVAREVTIQLRPTDGRDIEADLRGAATIATQASGVASVSIYSKERSARLLEPWLGNTLSLGDLPIPRLIVVRIAPGETPDFTALRQQLASIPGASFDDHRIYIERMRAMTRSAVAIGLGVLALVVAAAMMSVMFATRGAMAANRQIIEVLHVVGAKDGFIAAEFQRHFLLVGLKGGAMGGAIAMLLFALIGLSADWLAGAPSDVTALFGNLSLGIAGYGAIIGLVVLIAAVTAGTSRLTVRQTLKEME